MDDTQMYQTICKDRFDRINGKVDEVISILRGKNGNAGLVDDVRDLRRSHKRVIGVAVFILSAFLLQAIHTVWDWVF